MFEHRPLGEGVAIGTEQAIALGREVVDGVPGTGTTTPGHLVVQLEKQDRRAGLRKHLPGSL